MATTRTTTATTHSDTELTVARQRLHELEAQFEAAGGRGIELADEIDALRRKITFHGKKFYRTLITVEVLSDSPYDPASLEDVAYDITEGDCSGDWSVIKAEEVDSERMAELLVAQGSDSNFLFGELEVWAIGGDE